MDKLAKKDGQLLDNFCNANNQSKNIIQNNNIFT